MGGTQSCVQAAKMVTGAPQATAQVPMPQVYMAKPAVSQPFSNIRIYLVGPDNNNEVSQLLIKLVLLRQEPQL
jgi:hypothetical protein